MTTADWKGDTAKGAKYLSERQSRTLSKPKRKLVPSMPPSAREADRDFDAELRKYIGEPVDVLALIKQLAFTEEDVESAAMLQPTLYLDAARLRVQKMRKRAQAKIAWEVEKAQARIRIAGTVQEKTDRSVLKKSVRMAERAYESALAVEEFCKSLMIAFKERKDALRIVMDGRWAEAGSVVRKLKEREGQELARKVQRNVRDRYRALPLEEDDSEGDE